MRFICAGVICITENEEVGDIWWDFNTNFIKDGADGIPYESPRIKINFWSDLEKTQKEWCDFVRQEIGKNLSNIAKCFETLGYKVYTEYMNDNSWKWKIHIPGVDICKKNDEGKNLIVANIFPREYLLADKTGGKCWLCDLK